jgi:hypothetical protein
VTQGRAFHPIHRKFTFDWVTRRELLTSDDHAMDKIMIFPGLPGRRLP